MAILSFFTLNMAKKLLANQIPRILKIEYLKDCLSVWADFLHGNSKWWIEHDGYLFFEYNPSGDTFWAYPFWDLLGVQLGPKITLSCLYSFLGTFWVEITNYWVILQQFHFWPFCRAFSWSKKPQNLVNIVVFVLVFIVHQT